jgi:hypothetical protein
MVAPRMTDEKHWLPASPQIHSQIRAGRRVGVSPQGACVYQDPEIGLNSDSFPWPALQPSTVGLLMQPAGRGLAPPWAAGGPTL